MTIQIAPAFRVDTVRTHLHRGRAYEPARSPAELFADALLDELAGAVRIGSGRSSVTPAELAAMVEAAEKTAEGGVDPAVCPGCQHWWSDHVGRSGCVECDECRARRPHATESPWVPRVLPTAAEVARAYEDAYRHIPSGGAAK